MMAAAAPAVAPWRLLEQSAVRVVAGADGVRALEKRVAMADLTARSSKPIAKWAVSARSFRNEHAFLCLALARGAALAAAAASPLVLPTVFTASCADDDELPLESRWWSVSMTHFGEGEWAQAESLHEAEAVAAACGLADFHARYWGRVPPAVAAALFRSGGWWRRSLRPSVDFASAPRVWAELAASFAHHSVIAALASPHSALEWLEGGPAPGAGAATHVAAAAAAATAGPAMSASLAWLVAHLDAVAEHVEVAAGETPTTLVHGDGKTSNLFLSTDAAGPLRVALIDFQWTGGARSGCADLAYLLLAATTPALAAHSTDLAAFAAAHLERERRVLAAYHARLAAAFEFRAREGDGSAGGGAATLPYTWEALLSDFEWEVVDYFKTALVQLSAGLTPSMLAGNRRYGWLTHEFDEDALAWLLCRGLLALRRVERRYDAVAEAGSRAASASVEAASGEVAFVASA